MMRMMVEVAAEKKKKQRLHWGGLEATIVAVQLSSEQNNHVLPQLWPLSSREKRWFLDPFEDTTTKSKCMIWTSSMYLATGPASYPTFIIQLCTVARVPSHSASPDPALHQCSNQQPNLERDPSKPQGHHYLLYFKSLLFSILSPQKNGYKGLWRAVPIMLVSQSADAARFMVHEENKSSTAGIAWSTLE